MVTTAVNQKVKLKTSIPGVTLQLTFEILHFCQIYSSCTCTPLVAKDLICFFLSELQLLVTLVWMELKSLSEMFPYQFYCIFLGPGTAEPCELPSMGSPRVGHDLSDLAATAAGHVGGVCEEVMTDGRPLASSLWSWPNLWWYH